MDLDGLTAIVSVLVATILLVLLVQGLVLLVQEVDGLAAIVYVLEATILLVLLVQEVVRLSDMASSSTEVRGGQGWLGCRTWQTRP